MQIDFHFATTYVIARIAGFGHCDAEIIAYSSQYVDDSTTTGFLRFDNGMRYYREATAHPVLDLNNYSNDASAKSWLPFHFLPGNQLNTTTAPEDSSFCNHLICRPNSPVAQEMMQRVIEVQDRPHALHRLGIASHVFVDTFAHQGFIGQRIDLNVASQIQDHDGESLAAMHLPPIGHGIVSVYPDRPYLKWSYTDSCGNRIARDNPRDFTMAADELCKHYQRYLAGNYEATVTGLGKQKETIQQALVTITSEDEQARLNKWLDMIENDHFGFGPENISYVAKGEGSWKHTALGNEYLALLDKANTHITQTHQINDLFNRIGATLAKGIDLIEAHITKLPEHEQLEYKYHPAFISSNYKLFHDAAADQRHDLFTKIFPKFGIYAG